MAGPVFAGAVQVTPTLVRDTPVTVGAAGTDGGSSTSVTVTDTDSVLLPYRSLATTVTVRVARSSWLSTAAVDSWPLALMANRPPSPPPRLHVIESPSASVALKALPMAVPTAAFSATENVPVLVMTGRLLAGVAPLPVPDHLLVPSSFAARTRTS